MLTYKEFDALLDRFQTAKEWLDYRAGLICASLFNAHRTSKTDKVFSARDFMPGTARQSKRQTPEQMLQAIEEWQALYEAVK